MVDGQDRWMNAAALRFSLLLWPAGYLPTCLAWPGLAWPVLSCFRAARLNQSILALLLILLLLLLLLLLLPTCLPSSSR
ncbi:hypothetical protein IWX46DRAFT_250720 [Phyllosticta citricarpa]|uniref:Uncharacterized protein n=1 Tax=Phyllosticta citricarpa TaxID=55181 RepID=A0ABR1LRK2_9PEZI